MTIWHGDPRHFYPHGNFTPSLRMLAQLEEENSRLREELHAAQAKVGAAKMTGQLEPTNLRACGVDAQVSIELRVYLAAEAAMMAADDAGSDLGDLLRHAIMNKLWERLTDDERVRLLARSADDVAHGRVPDTAPEGVV